MEVLYHEHKHGGQIQTLKKNLHTLNTNAHYSIPSAAMSRTYDGHYLCWTILGSLFCVIVRLNTVRSSIYTSTWAVVDGKKFLSPPGS